MQQHKHAAFVESHTGMACQHHLVNTHLSTTLIILGGGGWRWRRRSVGWLMQVTCLHTWSIKSLTHCEASGGSNTKLPLISEATVPKNLIMFLCKHPESLSFNYIKKARD